jgi:hypothetical protein
MLAVASFFAGRVSLQLELERARAVAEEARAAQERAMRAEQEAQYLAALTQAQAMFRQAAVQSPLADEVQPNEAPLKDREELLKRQSGDASGTAP